VFHKERESALDRRVVAGQICSYKVRLSQVEVVSDPRLVAAIVDRMTFNGHIIETGSQSYRLASTRAKRTKTKTV
jgi:hypothetical protein